MKIVDSPDERIADALERIADSLEELLNEKNSDCR